MDRISLIETVYRKAKCRANPELVCRDEFSAGSLLPYGRVDLRVADSGYSHFGFAIAISIFGS